MSYKWLLLLPIAIASLLHAADTSEDTLRRRPQKGSASFDSAQDARGERSSNLVRGERSRIHRPQSKTTPITEKSKGGDGVSFLQLTRNDINMNLSGGLKDDFFFYNNVRTLRNDYSDQNNFVRHKMFLDFKAEQGVKRFGKPASEAEVKLTNYIYWQQYGHYMPFSRDDIRSTDLDSVIVARDVTVKTLMPLIFAEEAWFKLNLDTFWSAFKNHPAFLQVGFFKYTVGRGIALGYHDDLAVDYLGWPGEGHYTRYPHMPPGVLFRVDLGKNWSADLYWMKWTSVSTDLEDTLAPTRAQRLDAGPGRGTNKDRSNLVLKFDYTRQDHPLGDVHLQPYFVYTNAPEQSIEFEADASSRLTTLGAMVGCKRGNFDVNVEVAGQFGHQKVHAIDRNTKVLQNSGGSVKEVYSHLVMQAGNPAQLSPGETAVTRIPIDAQTNIVPAGQFTPSSYIGYAANQPWNRDLLRNAQLLLVGQGGAALQTTAAAGLANGQKVYNANTFGNARFRPSYRLNYQGFMALADVGYKFEEWPYKLTGAAGYISGDNYPYNDENNHTYYGFVPMRSRYTGYGDMENFLIFDRLVIPRPLNISNRTLWAYNNLKDLSNLQFLGVGLTWYPFHERSKGFCSANIWGLWEVAHLKAWDKYGHYPDATIDNQIALERARLGFPGVPRTKDNATTVPPGNTGWLSSRDASRMLGIEIDIRATYNFLDHANAYALLCLFMPGKLYRDVEGQPNFTTRRVDTQGLSHYDSLGSEPAFAAVVGFRYKF